MKTYIVVDVDIHDPETRERYEKLTPDSPAPFASPAALKANASNGVLPCRARS